jgi:hypothetical protein
MKMILLLLAGTLTGCQSWPGRAPAQGSPPPHRGVGTGAGSSGAMGSGTASGAGTGEEARMGGQQAACDLTRRIMGARSPEERQAMIEQSMPNMSQQSRERHLQMMREQCR